MDIYPDLMKQKLHFRVILTKLTIDYKVTKTVGNRL